MSTPSTPRMARFAQPTQASLRRGPYSAGKENAPPYDSPLNAYASPATKKRPALQTQTPSPSRFATPRRQVLQLLNVAQFTSPTRGPRPTPKGSGGKGTLVAILIPSKPDARTPTSASSPFTSRSVHSPRSVKATPTTASSPQTTPSISRLRIAASSSQSPIFNSPVASVKSSSSPNSLGVSQSRRSPHGIKSCFDITASPSPSRNAGKSIASLRTTVRRRNMSPRHSGGVKEVTTRQRRPLAPITVPAAGCSGEGALVSIASNDRLSNEESSAISTDTMSSQSQSIVSGSGAQGDASMEFGASVEQDAAVAMPEVKVENRRLLDLVAVAQADNILSGSAANILAPPPISDYKSLSASRLLSARAGLKSVKNSHGEAIRAARFLA